MLAAQFHFVEFAENQESSPSPKISKRGQWFFLGKPRRIKIVEKFVGGVLRIFYLVIFTDSLALGLLPRTLRAHFIANFFFNNLLDMGIATSEGSSRVSIKVS